MGMLPKAALSAMTAETVSEILSLLGHIDDSPLERSAVGVLNDWDAQVSSLSSAVSSSV
jgi:hypothetical protein